MSFASLGLMEPIVRAVTECGYTQPTPIQAQAIPAVLGGGDLLAGAQTGTGKTAGFSLPLLHRLMTTGSGKKGAIRALILTPTRELAAQIGENVRAYSKHLPLKSLVIFGGVNINPQIRDLRAGVDVLIATPGRLLDHAQQKNVDLSSVEILVLDEADRMLDMGFIRDIRKVLALLPKKRQNLLFSATFSDEIKKLADGLLKDPALIEVARRNAPIELVTQQVMHVDQKAKRHLLTHIIREQAWFQVLVFTRTKHGANRLAEQLTKADIPAMAIHGNKSQNARTRALSEFKSGKLQVLVATDIAARGLDIVELPHVVNFELPNVPEDYVHRIGRTGRAGATGEALSLVSPDETKFLSDIEKLTRRKIDRVALPDFEIPVTAAGERDERPPRAPQGRRQATARGAGPSTQPRASRREGSRAGAQERAPRASEAGEPRAPRNRARNRPEGNRQDQRADGERSARRGGTSAAGAGRAPQGKGVQSRPAREEGRSNRRPRREGQSQQGSGRNAPRQAESRAAQTTRGETGEQSGLRGVFTRGLAALRRLGDN